MNLLFSIRLPTSLNSKPDHLLHSLFPLQPQVEIPTLGNTSAPAEPTPEVSTEDEEIHDREISETHEAEGLKAHKPDETIGNIVQPILFFSFSPLFFNIYILCSLSFTLLRIDEILDELARENSPDQNPNPSLLNLQPSSPTSQGITHPDDQSSQQVILCFTLYF